MTDRQHHRNRNRHTKGRTAGLITATAATAAATALALLPAVSASAASAAAAPYPPTAPGSFQQTNLVSDVPGLAPVTDPHLKNPWGVSEFPNGPLWVSDAGAGVSTLYGGLSGGKPLTKIPLEVRIPGGVPTGQVFNATVAGANPVFAVHAGKQVAPAIFIFANLRGQISGWNPTLGVPTGGTSTTAHVAATVRGALFTGLAISGRHLYAANFAGRRVDVFNGAFRHLSTPGAFRDRRIPAGFAPFNVQALGVGGELAVAYAKRNPASGLPVAGKGLGFVDVFSPAGKLLARLAGHGALNAPWGMAFAPAGFGKIAGDLLVGNFGDGIIHAFNPNTGAFDGALAHNGHIIRIDHLWALIPGDSTGTPGDNPAAGTPDDLFFTAGIRSEAHGLLGVINGPAR